ncbi:PTS glucose transporter subunit IIA [Catenovulum sp. SM1970]|uniref:PTS sugar transporter subunit IIA n=1 Tax=Marinifaba aquimaris TaxID=2741323 RepID=UPI001572AAC4|nr:PTS glucose transporter subunit IIA [Marinifaba aquimaris]NTS76035.1 PTS glucose transporter subunit IIA [Marinifaba aquimaris]
MSYLQGPEINADFSAADIQGCAKLVSPCHGKVTSLNQHPRAMVKDGFFGPGLCFLPHGYQFFSPATGVIEYMTPCCHRINIKTHRGLKLHIEFAINTETLMSTGFKPKVEQGQQVKAGQLLFEFDLAYLKSELDDLTSFLTITNGDKLTAIYPCYHQVRAKDDALLYYRI